MSAALTQFAGTTGWGPDRVKRLSNKERLNGVEEQITGQSVADLTIPII
ncbi:hypothetical protein [Microvirga sp. VF16]|nr:hypothetical protein [Microvirga sp. VF16]QRM28173.1 hypothetical protein JO965_18250 [Microvirga sp. VF16]